MGKSKSKNTRMIEHMGTRVEELRELRGLSRKDLADKSGVHYDVIARIERDERRPRVWTLVPLADALNVSLTEFFVDPLGV